MSMTVHVVIIFTVAISAAFWYKVQGFAGSISSWWATVHVIFVTK